MSINSGNVNSGNEKYKVMHSAPDVRVGEGEYVNRLVIPNAAASDSGMYICFVTNSGFGPLTYKSAYLKVCRGNAHLEMTKSNLPTGCFNPSVPFDTPLNSRQGGPILMSF